MQIYTLAPRVGRGEKEGKAASNGSKNHTAPKYQNTHRDANLQAEARRAHHLNVEVGGIVRLDVAQGI